MSSFCPKKSTILPIPKYHQKHFVPLNKVSSHFIETVLFFALEIIGVFGSSAQHKKLKFSSVCQRCSQR